MSGAVPVRHPDLVLRQLDTPALGDHSYVLASAGELAVIDPQRDLDRLQPLLDELGGRVVAVLETHVHNDYVSGGSALAARSGAAYHVPAGAEVAVAARELSDGDRVTVGAVALRALHTPGHTPHHMSYEVLAEGDGGEAVVAVLTGGSVLVGAVGRSDLLGPELAEPLSRDQYRSAQRIGANPDPTVLGPTHGAGSFCSSTGVAAETTTTVGRERVSNPVFLAPDEDAFVAHHLSGRLQFPAYYEQMAPINRAGATAWEAADLPSLSVESLLAGMPALVAVDSRAGSDFAAGHLAGSVNVPMDDSFATYLGWVWPWGTRFALITGDPADEREAVRQVARIGIDSFAGRLPAAPEQWRERRLLERYQATDMQGLRREMDAGTTVLDVRQAGEWKAAHVPGSLNIHVTDLAVRLDEVPPGRVAVHCQSGFRASIAASMLAAAGREVVLVTEGFEAWVAAGLPIEWEPDE